MHMRIEKNEHLNKATNTVVFSEYLINNLENFEFEFATGLNFNFPNFELTPLEFIMFTEQEKQDQSLRSLLNCVGHLKRAVDCQLDIFLHVCNLYDYTLDKGISVRKKLEFMGDIGVFNSELVNKLISIRNKMEHYYQKPQITDIEVYYELVTAMTAVIQATITSLGYCGKRLDIVCRDAINGEVNGGFSIEYNAENMKFIASWKSGGLTNTLSASIKDKKEREDFTYLFRVLILMNQWLVYPGNKYIVSKLKI